MKHARVAWAGAIHDAVEHNGQLRLADGRLVAQDAVVWLPPLAPVTMPSRSAWPPLAYRRDSAEGPLCSGWPVPW